MPRQIFRLLTSESDDHEPSKHVLNELSSTTESLRQVSLEKNAALKLISELTLSVSHPIPLVVIKTDSLLNYVYDHLG